MKCNIKYLANEIYIPSLPEPNWEGDDECFFSGDDVPHPVLVVYSTCGETRFEESPSQKIEDVGEGYYVRSTNGGGIIAEYDGAFRALDARQDIDFPECEITEIRSTLGYFKTVEEYGWAREFLLPCYRGIWEIFEGFKSLKEHIGRPSDIYNGTLRDLEYLAQTQKMARRVLKLFDSYAEPDNSCLVNPPIQSLIDAIKLLKSASPEALELWLLEPGTEFEKNGVIYRRRQEGKVFRLDEARFRLTLVAHKNTDFYWEVCATSSGIAQEMQRRIISPQTNKPIKLSTLQAYYNNYLWINAQNVIAFTKYLSGNIPRHMLPHYGCMKHGQLEFALREQGFVPGKAFVLIDDTGGAYMRYQVSAFQLRNRMSRIDNLHAAAIKKLPLLIGYEYEELRSDSIHYSRKTEHDPKSMYLSPEKLIALRKAIRKAGGCLTKTLTSRAYDFSGPSWAHRQWDEGVAIVRYTLKGKQA